MQVTKQQPDYMTGLVRSDPRVRRPRAGKSSMYTNRSGNARDGQDFETQYMPGGDTVHVYATGERVKVHHDAPADSISRSLMSTKPKASSKNSAAAKAKAKAKRARARSNATTYNPAAPLSGDDLRRMVNDEVDLQTRPLLNDLDRQTTNTEAQSQRVTGNARNYYNDLLNRQQAITAAAQGIATQSEASQKAAADESAAAQGALATAAQKAQAADADVRGGVANIAADKVAQDLAARAQSVANRSSADAGYLSATNSSGSNLANEMSGVIGLKGGEHMKALTDRFAQQLGDIGAKRRDVVEQRGTLRTSILDKLRQQQYDNLVTAQGLGLKQDQLGLDQNKLDETNRHNSAMEKAAMTANQIRSMHNDQTYELDKQKFGASQAKDRYQKKHRLGPYKPGGSKAADGSARGLGSLSPSQETTKLDTIDSIRSLVQDGAKHFHNDWAQVARALKSGQNPEKRAYPALYVQVAVELERYGGISPMTATALQKRGIHVGGNFDVIASLSGHAEE